MVWLNTADVHGNGIYLNIECREIEKGRGEPRYVFGGIIGDGFYEGEVLLTVSSDIEITFVDEWMDRAGLAEFFDRVNRSFLEDRLREVVRKMTQPARVSRPLAEPPRSAGCRRGDAVSGQSALSVA